MNMLAGWLPLIARAALDKIDWRTYGVGERDRRARALERECVCERGGEEEKRKRKRG